MAERTDFPPNLRSPLCSIVDLVQKFAQRGRVADLEESIQKEVERIARQANLKDTGNTIYSFPVTNDKKLGLHLVQLWSIPHIEIDQQRKDQAGVTYNPSEEAFYSKRTNKNGSEVIVREQDGQTMRAKFNNGILTTVSFENYLPNEVLIVTLTGQKVTRAILSPQANA